MDTHEIPRHYGLTQLQILRCVLCERAVRPRQHLNKHVIADVLDIGDAQAKRFLRQMCDRGMMVCVYVPPSFSVAGACYGYQFTLKWRITAAWLRARGRLPGRCEVACCRAPATPHPYRGRYYCRAHLMAAGCRGCARRGTPLCAALRLNGERPAWDPGGLAIGGGDG